MTLIEKVFSYALSNTRGWSWVASYPFAIYTRLSDAEGLTMKVERGVLASGIKKKTGVKILILYKMQYKRKLLNRKTVIFIYVDKRCTLPGVYDNSEPLCTQKDIIEIYIYICKYLSVYYKNI